MADRLSPLAHVRLAPSSQDRGIERAYLSYPAPGSIVQVAAWPDNAGIVQTAIEEVLGVKAPSLGHAVRHGDVTTAALAPGRLLLSSDEADLAARFAAMTVAHGTVTDLSHARTIMSIAGSDVVEVLLQHVAIDLDLIAFPPGRVAQTQIHHIDVLIHRVEERHFDLWVFRSFAESLAHWLSYGDVYWHGMTHSGASRQSTSQTDL